MKYIIAAIAAALVGLFGAGTAHADDASYQQYLIDHGYGGSIGPAVGPNGPKITIPGAFVDWPATISYGHLVCDELHGGATLGDIQAKYPAWRPGDLRQVYNAAQSELCPDTL